MKASRYVKAFEKEVDHWERKLSHVLEVIEMILQVQRQWMYLEVNKHTTKSVFNFLPYNFRTFLWGKIYENSCQRRLQTLMVSTAIGRCV